MLDIKKIRKDPDFYANKIQQRNVKINLTSLLELDKYYRELIQKKEILEKEKKIISQKNVTSEFDKSKKISLEINQFNLIIDKKKNEINNLLNNLPNISSDDVPIGEDESSNKEIKKVGTITKFDFKPLSHENIGMKLNQMDFETATKTSGARFVFLKKNLAKLERALSNFMLDIHTNEFGYVEISPPLIAKDSSMYGTGQLPKFENDQFEIKLDDDKLRKFNTNR